MDAKTKKIRYYENMRRSLVCLVWFVVATLTYATTSSLLYTSRQKKELVIRPFDLPVASSQAPHFGGSQGIRVTIETGDARKDIVATFLERYNSPLQPYDHFAGFIVDTADKYGVDYRLIPAIMMQESNLCKVIPEGTYNCLGFGIHARGTLAFDSYEESIERATRELKANYIDRGLTTPEEIMTKYTPYSNGSWAASVNQWISEMEYNNREKGKTENSDADLTQYVPR